MISDITKNNDSGYYKYFELYARTKPKCNFDLAKILENVVVFIGRFDDDGRLGSDLSLNLEIPFAFDDTFNVEVKLK